MHHFEEDALAQTSIISDMSLKELQEEMDFQAKQFHLACQQIVLLNNQIKALSIRYETASLQRARSFRYSLRLRIATLEGVRMMFYDYARMRADILEDLQVHLMTSDSEEE